MSGWSPPSVPRNWLIAIGVAYALVVAYGLLVLQQLLLVSFPAVLAASLYLVWRLLVAIEAIADALQRIADQQEQERE